MSNRSARWFADEVRIAAAWLAACALLSGCGGSPKPTGQGIIQVPPAAAPPTATQVASAPGGDGTTKPNPTGASRSGKEKSRDARRLGNLPLFDNTGLSDETLIASEFDPTADHERWLVSEPSQWANEADRFAVVIPSGGVDSTLFELVSRPRSSTDDASTNPDFKLPAGFVIVEEAGWSSEGFPKRIRSQKDGSVMVFVPAGTFLQGTNAGTPDAVPEHAVELDAFYIDQAEVSNVQFEKFRADVRETKRVPAPVRSTANPREPVMGIAWVDAQAYAHWAGKELPTEAQWEKAARGASGFAYPWGHGRPVWQRWRQPGQIDAAMSFPGDVSPFGVFDLAGNAREWCADWYSDATYKLAVSGGVVPKNPSGPKNPAAHKQRVVKGGASTWDLWARAGVALGERPQDVGFRCVRTPKSSPATAADDAPEGKPKKAGGAAKSKSGGF